MNLSLSPIRNFIKRIMPAIALLFICQAAAAQNFVVNAIHCSMNDDNKNTLDKIGKFEGNFYNVIFDTHLNDTVTVKINLYGRHGEYKQVQKDNIKTTFIDGFYSGEKDELFLYKTDQFMNILLHETSHCLLRHNLNNPPRWLNEGIATLFGQMVIGTNGDVFYVKQTHYIKQMKALIASHSFSLNDYFHYRNEDWFEADKREVLYTVAYGVIYYFVETDIKVLQHYMLLLKQGNSSYNAIKKLYGSVDAFEGKLMEFYATQSSYSIN